MNAEIDYWVVSGRSREANRNIWKNGGVWWLSITLVNEGRRRAVRKSYSLQTGDVDVARRRRDRIIDAINNHEGMISV